MLVHRARDRSARLADFFVAAPGLGRPPRRARGDGARWRSASATAATTQPFRIGPASVAVPGAVAGLEAAHRALRRACPGASSSFPPASSPAAASS